MSAPAGWQKGSFRGVPFVTREHEASGGRRLVSHEFPQADLPVLEDLGKRAKLFVLDCYVLGADHIDQANRLADALEAAGAGTLIHPWMGSMQVGVDRYSRRDSVGEGRLSVFSIDFLESGLPAVPPPASDTAAIATAEVEAQAATGRFGGGFSVAGATAFVENAAERLAQGAALVAQVQAGLSGGVGGPLRAFQGAFDALGVVGIARDALGLGQSLTGMVQILGTLGVGPRGFEPLLDWGDTLPPVNGATPARAQERANQAAIVQLVGIAAASEIVRAIAGTGFASYDEAVALRDRFADRFDGLALRQADLGDDAGAAAFDTLRRVMVRDVTQRGGSLARLQRYSPVATEPALVIANRLYGAQDVELRAADIVARNGVRHPGFVPGGRAIEVLTPAGLVEGLGA